MQPRGRQNSPRSGSAPG